MNHFIGIVFVVVMFLLVCLTIVEAVVQDKTRQAYQLGYRKGYFDASKSPRVSKEFDFWKEEGKLRKEVNNE